MKESGREGVEGETGGGGACGHAEAAWSKAIRDLVFFPSSSSSSVDGAEVRAEPQRGGELCRKKCAGGRRGKRGE